MKSIFFSVVIPTYNQDFLLKGAIQSVLKQSYKNFEIIIIDNFSEDNTEEVVKNFKSKKIKYVKMKNSGIIGKSRNKGIVLSKGKWIAFLDSDDTWHFQKLEKICKFLKKNSNNYTVICNDEFILYQNSKKRKIWKYGPYTKNFYENLLRNGNCISTSASLVEKRFLTDCNILFSEKKSFVTAEDYDFFLKIAFYKGKFKFFHKILGSHLFHNKSYSQNFNLYTTAALNVAKYHIKLNQIKINKPKKLLKKVNLDFLFKYMIQYFNKGDYLNFLIIIFKINILNPIYLFEIAIIKIKKRYNLFQYYKDN